MLKHIFCEISEQKEQRNRISEKKREREKKEPKGTRELLPSYFSLKVIEARRQLCKIFKTLKENILILENYTLTNSQVNVKGK